MNLILVEILGFLELRCARCARWTENPEVNVRLISVPHYRLPYFVREWKEEKDKSKFKSFDDIKEFVRSKSLYQFWSRCEYEMIVKGWPVTKREIKLDVHEQIMMNLDLVTQVFINTIGWKVK